MPRRRQSPEQEIEAAQRLTRPAALVEKAAAFYQQVLPDSRRALDWLRGAGLAAPELVEAHRLGFCDGSLSEVLPADDAYRNALSAAGILAEGQAERVLDCVVFPSVRSRRQRPWPIGP